MKMKKKNFVALALAFAMSLSLAACGSKEEAPAASNAPAASAPAASTPAASTPEEVSWPTGQVEIVVPAKAGGSQDLYARIVADYLTRNYGATVIVNNLGDGNGVVGFEYVRQAEPDGSVLLYNYTGNLASMYCVGKYDYNPAEAFTAIAQTEAWSSSAAVVPADCPFDTLGDWVANLKATGEVATMGCQLGSFGQARCTVFGAKEGINLEMVEAMTATDKISALAGGFIDITFLPLGTAMQYEESGDLKILGVLRPERDALYPDYPSVFESGITTWSSASYSRVYGPAGMDTELASAINEALAGMKDDATTVEQMKNLGSTFVDGYSLVPLEEAQALIAADDQACRDANEAAGFLIR